MAAFAVGCGCSFEGPFAFSRVSASGRVRTVTLHETGRLTPAHLRKHILMLGAVRMAEDFLES